MAKQSWVQFDSSDDEASTSNSQIFSTLDAHHQDSANVSQSGRNKINLSKIHNCTTKDYRDKFKYAAIK